MANNPRSVLSPMDAEIQRNCESLIETIPLRSDMIGSIGNLSSYFKSSILDKIPFIRKSECNESNTFLLSFDVFKQT